MLLNIFWNRTDKIMGAYATKMFTISSLGWSQVFRLGSLIPLDLLRIDKEHLVVPCPGFAKHNNLLSCLFFLFLFFIGVCKYIWPVIWPEVTFLSPYTLRDWFAYFACYSRIDLGSSISIDRVEMTWIFNTFKTFYSSSLFCVRYKFGLLYTVGTESIQTTLIFLLFVILQPFAKII